MKNLSYESDFNSHENEPVDGTHFHLNGFAGRLVLTQRQKVSWNCEFWREFRIVPDWLTAPFNNMRTPNFKLNRQMRFSLPSIKCSAAPPSFRRLPSAR